jgi:hypothetical protein
VFPQVAEAVTDEQMKLTIAKQTLEDQLAILKVPRDEPMPPPLCHQAFCVFLAM